MIELKPTDRPIYHARELRFGDLFINSTEFSQKDPCPIYMRVSAPTNSDCVNAIIISEENRGVYQSFSYSDWVYKLSIVSNAIVKFE